MALPICLSIPLLIIGIGLTYLFYDSLVRIRNASESIAQSLEIMARHSRTYQDETEG
ncbi:MAG TPA: hypothetical protein VD886_14345 [Herpetosiphonaceae bacterium]|nr:hypothetical protein [Herpetosiphonaceae bacterium]